VRLLGWANRPFALCANGHDEGGEMVNRRMLCTRVGRRALAVALVAAAALIAGCGGSDSGNASKSGSGKVTITWWDYFGYAPGPDREVVNLLHAYEKAHPNVTIKRTSLGYPDMHTKLIQATATGTQPDIAVIDNVDLPVFASQGGLADLTAKMNAWPEKAQYYPNILKPYEGKYYMMPFRSNTIALFYNKDQFKEAGITKPPTTWEELRATAKKLTKGDRFGYCFAATNGPENDYQFLPFLWQAGGDLPTLGDAASVKALTLLNDLVNVDKSSPSAVVSWNQPEMAERFNSGNCAMMQNGPWQIQPAIDAKLNFGVTVLPHDVKAQTVLGGENMVASKKAPLDTVWDLMTFVQQSKNLTQGFINETGALQHRQDQVPEKKYYFNPAVKPFAESLKVARSRQYGPNYGEIQPHLWAMVQQVITRKKTPEQAAKEAGAAIKPLLDK
jgi:multiple sugar transport system substrate-binding protein